MGGDILVYYSREVCAHKYGRLFWTYPIVLTEDLRCLVERKYNQCPRQDRYDQFCPIDTKSPFWTVAKATRILGIMESGSCTLTSLLPMPIVGNTQVLDNAQYYSAASQATAGHKSWVLARAVQYKITLHSTNI